MDLTQRMVPIGKGKRAGIKLDEATWQAVEWLADQAGKSWQEWCADVIRAIEHESINTTAAVRVAAMDGLLAQTVLSNRADQMTGYQPIAMRMSAQCSDDVFKDDLRQSHIESESNFVGFNLRSGTDPNGRVCYWIENGLRDGSHIIVRTPFTPEDWQNALEAINED